MSGLRRLAALLSVFSLVALACGQKPGVHLEGETVAAGDTSSTTGLDGSTTDTSGLDGSTTTDTTTGTTDTTGTTGDTTGTTTGTNGTNDTTGDTSGDTGGDTGSTTIGSDRTGVEADKITIALHAPVTGAAPIRSDSFRTGKDLYWDHGDNGKPVEIYGRQVEVLFADDKYNPSTAKSVCQQMAESGNAFLLIGGGGTDQIKACADYAHSKGIPYLSAGVTENGLRGLPEYFAVSMSYKQQVPLLAQYVKNVLHVSDNSKVVMIASDTANFDDAVGAFEESFPGAAVIRSSKSGSGTEYADDVCNGPAKKYDVVFPLTSPTFFLELEGSAACNPQYAGLGITHGLNTVASTGCRTATGSMNGARFFSPAFAYKNTATEAKDFRAAGGIDDIQFLIWGISKALHQLLLAAGEDLTREGFIAAAQNATGIETGVFPELNYSPTNHFGAAQVHVLKAVCSGSGGEYVTERYFAGSF
ncbi:MAG TPA: ABC transporter substrate-binding protein [Actinomycetota bacterium]